MLAAAVRSACPHSAAISGRRTRSRRSAGRQRQYIRSISPPSPGGQAAREGTYPIDHRGCPYQDYCKKEGFRDASGDVYTVIGGVDLKLAKLAVGGIRAGGRAVARAAARSASDDTEVVIRWMNPVELAATEKAGLVRGGRDGTHYVTPSASNDPLRARQRLALPKTPTVPATLRVPAGSFTAPTRVAPNFGMPGGGLERLGQGPIPCTVLCAKFVN